MAGGTLLVGMFCVAIIVAGALGTLVFLLLRPAGTKTRKPHPTQAGATQKKAWQGWIVPIIIALILAVWTVAGALFFLAIVWVMKLNPKPYIREVPHPSKAEIASAKGPYTWLFLSPFLTIPTLILIGLNLSYRASINERVIVAIIPILFHLPLLARLDPKSAFIFRHTQQAFLLVALRAGMAALALSIGNVGDGAWLFLIGNGSLWLFGTIWARNQAIRGECWWSKRRGESIAPKTEIVSKFDLTRVARFSPKENLEKSREYIQHYQQQEARDHALAAFRFGDREERTQAAWLLEVLEEVETF
jgi:hypothetical protein